ncbi:MAG: hypothetical protein JNJ41_20195 [Bacteroidia bacterium]|nr:hypothetical protein [Bacteroidia bacterium]MDP3145597.1 hypothetical protein [Bacteroidota bacterium]
MSIDLLKEHGFIENVIKTNSRLIVMTKDEIDIIIKNDNTFYYSNNDVDYTLKDIAALRKLYRELRNEDLKPSKNLNS